MIFADYPGHFVALLLALSFGGMLFLAFRSGELCKDKRRVLRHSLTAMRVVVVFLLLLILWNPSGYKKRNVYADNSVLAIFDTSRSMSIRDDGDTARLDKAVALFDDVFAFGVQESPACRVFGFDERAYHSGSTNLLRRWGPRTDMHSVFELLGKYDVGEYPEDGPAEQKTASGRVAGAVIFTDGRVEGRSAETYAAAVSDSLPVLIVGVGSRENQVDLAIKSIDAPPRIAIDSAFNVKVGVGLGQAYDRPVVVELLRDGLAIDSREIPAERPGRRSMGMPGEVQSQDVTVEFAVAADKLGPHCYSARIEPVEREANTENNVRNAMVEVADVDTLKVLLYSMTANFNVGKIRQALAADPRIELELSFDVIRSPVLSGDASQACGYVDLPEDREGFCRYDVIILGPCDLMDWSNAQVDGLHSFVADRGGGLILLPGRGELGPAMWTRDEARELLPAILDPRNERIWPPNNGQIELAHEGLGGQVFNGDDLGLLDGPTAAHYRIVETKPAATVLAHIHGTPAMAIHRVGRGKVCLLNVSKLFLWYDGNSEGGLLSRVFSSLVSVMAGSDGGTSNVEVFFERADRRSGAVRFSAYVCDESSAPLAGANVLLTVGDRVLPMYPTARGYYTAQVDDADAQSVVATVQAESGGVFIGEKTVAANLPPVQSEMSETRLDEEFLRSLAKEVKGRYVHIDDLKKDAADMFEAKTLAGVSEQVTSLWPTWPLLLVLFAILSFGWFLRRAKGLV